MSRSTPEDFLDVGSQNIVEWREALDPDGEPIEDAAIVWRLYEYARDATDELGALLLDGALTYIRTDPEGALYRGTIPKTAPLVAGRWYWVEQEANDGEGLRRLLCKARVRSKR